MFLFWFESSLYMQREKLPFKQSDVVVSHNVCSATLEHSTQSENIIWSVLIIHPKYRKIMH